MHSSFQSFSLARHVTCRSCCRHAVVDRGLELDCWTRPRHKANNTSVVPSRRSQSFRCIDASHSVNESLIPPRRITKDQCRIERRLQIQILLLKRPTRYVLCPALTCPALPLSTVDRFRWSDTNGRRLASSPLASTSICQSCMRRTRSPELGPIEHAARLEARVRWEHAAEPARRTSKAGGLDARSRASPIFGPASHDFFRGAVPVVDWYPTSSCCRRRCCSDVLLFLKRDSSRAGASMGGGA